MATANLNRWSALGTKYTFYATRIGAYPYGTSSSALAAGADSGAGRLKAINTFEFSRPSPNVTVVTGDNGTQATFVTAPTDSTTGTTGLGLFDQTFSTLAESTGIVEEGDWDISAVGDECITYQPMIIVQNSPAQSVDGDDVWMVEIYLNVKAHDLGAATKSINTALEFSHALTFNMSGYAPWGQLLSAYSASLPEKATKITFESPNPVALHTYVGDGTSAQTVTLDYTPAADDGDKVKVWDNGTAMTHTTDYSVNTSTRVLTYVGTAPADGNVSVILYQFTPDC